MPSTTATDAQRRDDATDVLPARRAFIKSFGCQMNVYDSQRMADVAGREGYDETADVEDADLVILNTCHIREKAAEKIYSELGQLRAAEGRARAPRAARPRSSSPAASPRPKARRSCRRQPAVDLVVGPQSYHRLPRAAARPAARAGGDRHRFPGRRQVRPSAAEPRRRRSAPAASTAFVTVQEGCDKFCSFCVVPYTRGARGFAPGRRQSSPRSRGSTDAGVARDHAARPERQRLSRRATRRAAERTWPRLLAAARRDAAASLRLRYTTSHPNDMSDEPDRRPSRHADARCPICICRCSRARTASWRR